MKKIQILSLVLVGMLSFGVLEGCSSKQDKESTTVSSIQAEEGKTLAIAENSIIPTFVTSRYGDYSSLVQDYVNGVYTFRDGKTNNEFAEKYGYQELVKKETCTCKDAQQINPEFYEGFSTFLYFQSIDKLQHPTAQKYYLQQIQNYLQDTLLDEKNDGYVLADDFSKLNPKKVVQDYLKENKIKITDIQYPDDSICFDSTGTGTSMLTVSVPIKGTKDGKTFSDIIKYDFHFVVSKDLREGANFDGENIDKGEIMAVTNSFHSDTIGKIGGFDYKKLEETMKSKNS